MEPFGCLFAGSGTTLGGLMQSMRRIHGSLACRRFSKVSLHVTAGLPECASLRCQGHSPLPDHHGGCRPYAKQHLETLSHPVRGEDRYTDFGPVRTRRRSPHPTFRTSRWPPARTADRVKTQSDALMSKESTSRTTPAASFEESQSKSESASSMTGLSGEKFVCSNIEGVTVLAARQTE
jgi:hypothetical protein